MTRRQQHLGIWVSLTVLLVGLPLVLPGEVVMPLVGALLVFGLVGLAARGEYGVGRRLLAKGQFEEAHAAFVRFEQQLVRQPWRARLAFLYAGFSTSDGPSLAQTYQGIARLEQGRLVEADAHFSEAIARDEGSYLPWANRAIVAASAGRTDEARTLAATALRLGAPIALARALETVSRRPL